MNDIKKFFDNLTPKKIADGGVMLVQNHLPVLLTLLAGAFIGFALYSVNSLSQESSQQVSEAENSNAAAVTGLNIDEDLQRELESLSEDSDVVVSSNIATYRRSAFSNATQESQWVIDAANALEEYYGQQDAYPRGDQVVTALRDGGVSPEDSNGNILGGAGGSNYSYQPSICDDSGCQAFILGENLGSSTYQLGEKDVLRRDWVNKTAEALVGLKNSSPNNVFPTEQTLIGDLTTYYQDTFESEFDANDPRGREVNSDGGSYSYIGVDCDASGCENFVLRTTFKDGALYFQQSN